MRMSFTADDEDAFYGRRDELREEFGTWLDASRLAEGEPGYAEVAMDWKWGYQDGNLGRWTVADLEEFLLRWCPRTLSVPAEECAAIPGSIRAFMTFLDSQGLLASGSSSLAQLQRCCERNTSRFVTEMANPAHFGLAKGLFAQAGGLEPDMKLDEDTLNAVLERMPGLQAGGPEFDEIDDAAVPVRTVGPVTPPDPDERAQAAAAAPALAQLQQLWEFCAAPGRPLTQKGNLRLADARHLVDVLGTGDEPDVEIGDYRRSLRSAEDLPVLSWLVELAIDARVLRRHRGRLVAVARWRELSPVQAVDRLVDAAVAAGLSGFVSPYFPWLATVRNFIDEGAGRLLAELLDARSAGRPQPIDELTELMVEAVAHAFAGLHDFHLDFVRGWVRDHLDRLAALGIVTVRDVAHLTDEWGAIEPHGGIAELTPAGVPIAVRLAEELGIIVLRRPDPTTTAARDLVKVMEHMEPDTWVTDAGAWVAHRGPEVAAREIVAVLNDAEMPPPIVFVALGQLNELTGEHAVPAIRTMLGGPHDGLAVQVLVLAGALDPAEVHPDRLLRSGVDLMAVMYDIGGVDDLVAMLNAESHDLLDMLWHADHPRAAELLAVVAEHHPEKRVAKSARKALLRHRSWRANRQ